MTETNDEYQAYHVMRDGEPDLKFQGKLIADNASSSDRARGDYSGTTGRWTELELYKSAGGKFVCVSVGRTQWQGEHDRFSAKVCETEAEVIEFFGHGWLAKRIYCEAGIDAAENID